MKLLNEKCPNLRKATNKHFETCGCETCITVANMQNELNKHRLKLKKDLERRSLKSKMALEKSP